MPITTTDISNDYIINAFSGSLQRGDYKTITSGSGGVVEENFAPFRFSVNGAFNLRNQSAENHYKTFVGEQKT